MTGRLKEEAENIFLSKSQLRTFTTSAYNNETGNKSIRKGFSSGKLKFIKHIHRLASPST
jgi:hypothetical protein